ncbi:EF-hand domain-containing protein [Pseudomonas sp. PDM30]|jgi:Ca2+-binding EF-hand superfamily protein|uniref:EF-hand domain-containing protein n=1 Tax=Pseudomonas sp. PDM30 TaxID=2854773 RepID=UPI001C453286|nr:EF-hand domain-containing protein [Pseudomonas sp. PDM30]MBV7487611.1 EF-hand domain-containing protein [Pseudomonas sp. PDM30]
MIGSISSNYSNYTSSTTSNSARNQQLQKDLLAKLDSNSDGTVDQNELKSVLSQQTDDGLLVNLSKNFTDLDSDGSGSLSGEEMAVMAPPPPPPGDEAPNTDLADALISALDADGDGTISSDELSSALQASNSNSSTSTDTSTALLKALDSDSSGGVSSDELKAALQAGREQNTNSSSDQSSVNDALQKMIANLSKQYSLDNVASVGKHLNVAT